jgi:hypothetical protein
MSAFAINEKGDYFIIEEHEIEMLDGFDVGDVEEDMAEDVAEDVDEELTEVELLVGEEGLERSEKHDEREMREKCVNSVEKEIENEKEKEKEKPNDKLYNCDYTWGGNLCNSHRNTRLTTCINSNINTNIREMELKINTSTVEEVIFKKHKVEIINIDTRRIIMEGVVSGYSLVGRVYDPDIVLNFDDGRSFYNENFGYLMRFYM